MAISYPHRLFSWLGDLVFPYRCLGCSAYLDKKYICDTCIAKMPVRARLECIGCRQTSPAGLTCDECKPDYAINRVFIISEYHDSIVARAIKGLKYKFLPELVEPLAQLAGTYIQNQSALHHIAFASEEFIVMPVPLHRRRENWRGFNQAAQLARAIASRYRLEYVADNLIRTEHIAPQASIKNRAERLEHVKNKFDCLDARKLKGRNILLVDDVCTTGATLNECARVLQNAGTNSVTALVIARG